MIKDILKTIPFCKIIIYSIVFYIIFTLIQGCSTVSHHELEYRCSHDCNQFINKMKNYEFDSVSKLSHFFGKEEELVCDDPIGTFNCAE